MRRRHLVAGNWKMNGSIAANRSLMVEIAAAMPGLSSVEVLVCPPTVYLDSVCRLIGSAAITLGAQNLSEHPKPGAYTGETLGAMLRELGCLYVLVGHSERRALYGETDAVVAAKFQAAQSAGLIPVLCLGETLAQRERGETEVVLRRQLEAVLDTCGSEGFGQAVVAYEPVWAIGTGRTASSAQAQAAHAFLRGELRSRSATIADRVRILYGGSVKPDNASELFACPDVDGGLIGGASLKSGDFLAICQSAQAQTA